MLLVRLLLIAVAAWALTAQDHVPRARVELLESVQNDLNGVIARGTLAYDDRVALNDLIGVIGKNIGSERGSHNVDEKELKNALKEIQKISKKSGIGQRDRVALEEDCEALKYNLEHGLPVYRGYKQPVRY